MEASAYFETATRFSAAELVQCLKVVSDNRSSPAENITPRQVSALIATHIATLEGLLAELTRLSGLITEPVNGMFADLIKRYRFTVSEQTQLKKQLNRWGCLTDYQLAEIDETGLRSAKDVLNWLERKIGNRDFYL